VRRVRPDGCRGDEVQRVERGQADHDHEGVPRERADDASSGGRLHATAAWRRTQTDRAIRTLAMPKSITATAAAVPFAPFEKLRQMYSSITLEAYPGPPVVST